VAYKHCLLEDSVMSQDDGGSSRLPSGGLIALAIVAAAAIIAYGSGDEVPRYQLVSTADAVVQMDTDSGELIACNLQRCVQIRPPDRARTANAVRNMLPGAKAIEGNASAPQNSGAR